MLDDLVLGFKYVIAQASHTTTPKFKWVGVCNLFFAVSGRQLRR